MNISNCIKREKIKMAKKGRVTANMVGDVYCLIDKFLSKYQKENFKVTGLEFSNLGAQGRIPLFDATYSKKGTIMAYWKDELQNCIVITAPEPGYEIKAPKCLRHFFDEQKNSCFHPTYLDVSHLDVSNTTDFSYCFFLFGYSPRKKTKDVKIIGLETWDVSNGKDFRNMFDRAFPFNESINLNLSSWRFSKREEISFYEMFHCFGKQASKVILDISGWDTTNVDSFAQMFKQFAFHAKTVELKGIEKWKMHNKMDVSRMFAKFAPNSDWYPNLSKWDMKGNLPYKHKEFAVGLFFKIREPEWI